jgi:hypothetical protein
MRCTGPGTEQRLQRGQAPSKTTSKKCRLFHCYQTAGKIARPPTFINLENLHENWFYSSWKDRSLKILPCSIILARLCTWLKDYTAVPLLVTDISATRRLWHLLYGTAGWIAWAVYAVYMYLDAFNYSFVHGDKFTIWVTVSEDKSKYLFFKACQRKVPAVNHLGRLSILLAEI